MFKISIKTLEQGHWRRSGVFTANFEHNSHLFLVFLLLTLNRQMFVGLILQSERESYIHIIY